MQTLFNPPKTAPFVGRTWEQKQLLQFAAGKEAAIIVVHGRRRVGKTELIQHTFRERGLLKFEGIEGEDAAFQRSNFLQSLAVYTGKPSIARIKTSRWREVFEILADHVAEGRWTIFLEELQWMASYATDLIAELKYVWDNQLRCNPELLLVLCGSSPAFMVRKVLRSKALYNRSQYELPLQPFSPSEVREFLGASYTAREVMDTLLLVGGIPEYLRRLKSSSSLYVSLCQNSFVPGAFFLNEPERIFVSSLSENPFYRPIIELLAKRRYATRNEIISTLKTTSGSHVTRVIEDLEISGFIHRYRPYNASPDSTVARYEISDPYLQFYYSTIRPREEAINRGEFREAPEKAVSLHALSQWLGYSFERFCRANSARIAQVLGFRAVEYQVGPYFNRGMSKELPGMQLDLVFDRKDRVLTVCEIKYTETPVTKKTAAEFLRKLDLLAPTKEYRVHRVLVSAAGATEEVRQGPYFDEILELKDLI